MHLGPRRAANFEAREPDETLHKAQARRQGRRAVGAERRGLLNTSRDHDGGCWAIRVGKKHAGTLCGMSRAADIREYLV